MSLSEEYKQDHKIAKFLVCFTVVLLMVLNKRFDVLYLDVAAVIIWFFGVNTTAYVVEALRHHSHKHDRI